MINKSIFKKTLLIIAAVNILSFLSYHSLTLNWLCFILILTATAALAWRNLFWGAMIIIGELMISSQGHLFDLYLGSFRLSLRMGLFAIVLMVALVQFLISNFKFLIKSQYLISNIQYLIKNYKFYFLLALFIIFGIINGIIHHNNLNFLYQDANGYLFFLLLPVFIIAFKKSKISNIQYPISNILTIWSAAITWQFIISITLLFLYGHLDVFWRNLVPLYSWFRDQRLIEVGLYKYNFYRVFMQSGIWALTGFFVFLSAWLFTSKRKKLFKLPITNYQLLLIFTITTLIISLSRSFWLAGLLTFIAFIIFYLYIERPKIKTILYQSINLATVLIASFAIIAVILLIPIGKTPGLKSLSFLEERTMETEDPAIASRWKLLSVLWNKIEPYQISGLFGHGFGATVTYKTADPRYLAAHPDNPYYTAFAFEWGWLDVWYKIGFFGLLTYLLLIGNILKRGWGIIQNSKFKIQNYNLKLKIENTEKHKIFLTIGLFFGLIALIIVNFFTPFLNHPLGIGYLLLTDAMFRTAKKLE